MARPKKYRTKAEKRAANRAKNKVYYEKNKDTINKRRRDKRAKQKSREARKEARKELKAWMRLGASGDVQAATRSLFLAVERARVAFSTFKKAVEPNVREFTLTLCEKVLELRDEGDDVETARVFLEGHAAKLEACNAKIKGEYDTVFTLSGVGDSLNRLDSMLKEVHTAIQMVEDLDTHLMEGYNALETALQRRELLVFNQTTV
ncbi:hypothetical protein CC2G_001702 [Coprinopsis cinerea AmutBmut pab1-1]|nr:hypothetical protein CC2G_001702 [Coprinopsis cinerea AmutBmut pab1-1]